MRGLRRDETKERTDAYPADTGWRIYDRYHREKERTGAYICYSKECFQKAVKNKGLERSFKQTIPQEVYDRLEKEMGDIAER